MLKECGFILITYFIVCSAQAESTRSSSYSASSGQAKDGREYLEHFSPSEAHHFLVNAINNFSDQELGLKFSFIHKGAIQKQANRRFSIEGYLFGKIHQGTHYKRIILMDTSGEISADFIFHQVDTGIKASVWKRSTQFDDFRILDEGDFDEPLVAEILFRPIDILMSYLRWDDYDYLGPGIMGIRGVVQKYSLRPAPGSNQGSQAYDSVQIDIDSDYLGIKKIKYLKQGIIDKEMVVSGLKKIHNQWTISRMIMKDPVNKVSTIFKVLDNADFTDEAELNLFDPKLKHVPSLN